MNKKAGIWALGCILAFAAAAFSHTADAPFTTPLIAGGGNVKSAVNIGTVQVWNDCETLYVKFVSTGDCLLETHVHVAATLEEIPQKNGNPIPGRFDYSDPHECVQEYVYPIPLSWYEGEEIYIAAHAVTGVAETMWVSSDGTETFVANSGPGTDFHHDCIDGAPRGGTAVPAWQHSAWGVVTSQFDEGTWIWEAYRVVNPICGDVVDFSKTFTINGVPTAGTLKVTADNGYAASLNGVPLGGDGLSGDWRTSNLTEPYVTTASTAWSSVESFSLTNLAEGANTLDFATANEYFNTDDGHGSPGTVDSNPGGLIYEAEIDYLADGETAWGAGEDFPGKNWATYFTYTVQGCTNEIPPGGGFAYIGYEDWLSGDFDYNDFGMNFRATEHYEYCAVEGYEGVTRIEIEVEPVIYDSGMDHIIHFWRSIVGDRTITVTHYNAGTPGPIFVPISGLANETLSGAYVGSGNVDVILFNTSKYTQPTKLCTNGFNEETVTIEIEIDDPCSNPKNNPIADYDRWDIDPVWQGYDLWEEGTIYSSYFTMSNTTDVFTAPSDPSYRERAWQSAGHTHAGGGSCGADPTLDNVRLPMILVIPVTDWIPPFENTSITSPYADFKEFYETEGVSGENWFLDYDCSGMFPWNSASCGGSGVPGQYGCISCAGVVP